MSVACFHVDADPTFYGRHETAEGQREIIARSMGLRPASAPVPAPRRSYTQYLARIYTTSKTEAFEPEPETETEPLPPPEPLRAVAPPSYRRKLDRHLSPAPEDYSDADVAELIARINHNARALLEVAVVRGVTGFENDLARFLMRSDMIRRLYDSNAMLRQEKARKSRKRAKANHPKLGMV